MDVFLADQHYIIFGVYKRVNGHLNVEIWLKL